LVGEKGLYDWPTVPTLTLFPLVKPSPGQALAAASRMTGRSLESPELWAPVMSRERKLLRHRRHPGSRESCLPILWVDWSL